MDCTAWVTAVLVLWTSNAAARAQGDAGGASAAPQGARASGALDLAPALRDAHAIGVLAERRAALAETWAASTEEGRAAARAVLLARTNFGPAALLAPPELVLAQATRFARGDVAPGAPYPAVVAIADALDLRLVPGALEADRATDAAVHLCWVQPPLHSALPETVELRLAVVTPVPGAKHRVQTCASFVFRPHGLGLTGVVVPVSLPALAAGEHWLAAELAHEGHAVPGFFVSIEVVEGLDGALAARPVPEGSPLDALLRFGVRAEGRGRLAEWFASEAATPTRTLGAPSAAALLGAPLDSPARVTVFVDVPPPMDPAGWLAGREGAEWRHCAGADRRVVALRLDLSRGLALDDYAGTSLGLVASIAAADPDSARVLVVRGERVGALKPLLEAPGDLFQGLVLVGAPGQSLPRGWRGAAEDRARPERRTLVVTCLADEDAPLALGALPAAVAGPDDKGAARVVRVTRRAPPVVVSAEVPRLVQAFGASVAAPALKAPLLELSPDGASPDAASPRAKAPPPEGMLPVPASVQVIDGERFEVPEFYADRTEVTNAEFARFVAATGHVSDAEKIGDSVCYVFGAGPRGEPIFALVPGAEWRCPEGPGSSLAGRDQHPVVHVSWNDASAYARWAGKRLPSRAEWYAMARGAVADQVYPWGGSLERDSGPAANVWQGVFPLDDLGRDGFRGTSPVGAFAPGTHGLSDVGGNVWEWTAERSIGLPAGVAPGDAPEQDLAATRGGSFLCREEAAPPFQACRGYRIGAVEHKPLIDSNNQVGFRCVKDA